MLCSMFNDNVWVVCGRVHVSERTYSTSVGKVRNETVSDFSNLRLGAADLRRYIQNVWDHFFKVGEYVRV